MLITVRTAEPPSSQPWLQASFMKGTCGPCWTPG
uniref:Pk3 n=1 Tax=Arundo donax TaxID=35708 RepID=A0A0A9HA88_ARUDO